MSGRIMVTGGSGFVGSAVIKELRSRGYLVHALVNRKDLPSTDDGVRIFRGGLFDTGAIAEAIFGCQAVVHLVGIIMEKPAAGVTFDRIHYQGSKRVIDGTIRAGVKRYLHMSALGSRANAESNYHRTKYQAEEYARASGLNWTIFRPSLIHGPCGEFMQMEARWARGKAPPFLFMPYFGAGLRGNRGAGKLQPVFVDDVARALVDAIEKPKTVGEIYPLGGPDEVTWPQLHRMSAKAIVGHERWVLPIPAWYAKMITHVVPGALLPFNRDQVIMSQEDNTCDLSKFRDTFGWEPRPVRSTLVEYAKEL